MTEGYFPGSSVPLAPPAGPRDPLGDLKGKMYPVAGTEVELFTLGQVAEALNRRPVTIRGWERDGVIPAATFVRQGANGDVRGKRRLYSREQVEALVRIASEEGILKDKSRRVERTAFTQRVRQAFAEIARSR